MVNMCVSGLTQKSTFEQFQLQSKIRNSKIRNGSETESMKKSLETPEIKFEISDKVTVASASLALPCLLETVQFPDTTCISEGFEETQDRRYCLPTLAAE